MAKSRYFDEVNVTDEWFVPLREINPGEARSATFLSYWKKYGERADWYGDMWFHRIARIVAVKNGCTTYSGRVATTLFIWFSTNVGMCFLETALKGLKNETETIHYADNKTKMIEVWSIENSLLYGEGQRKLAGILGKEKLSMLDCDIAESLVVWLSTPEARKLLFLVYRALGMHVSWVVPSIRIIDMKEPGEF